MSRRRKLQDNDKRYNFLHLFVNFAIKVSYRDIKYIGKERIPKDAAVIFAPNHTGALMDALVLLAMDSKPKVFIARADIFKNPKIAKILRFMKIMPIMRMRDGVEEVKKNNKTIETAADVLKDKTPLCIFPEGTHQTKYSMLPLSKGIFRIALQAKELLGEKPLYIVPVGIRYGNFYRFRSSVHIQFGNPINIGEFIADNNEKSVPEQMNLMRELLTQRIRENIHYIPNNEEYDAKNEICAAMYGTQRKRCKKHGANALVTLNRQTAKEIETLKTEKPEAAERLIALGNEAAQLRKANRISLKSVAKQRSIPAQIARALLLFVTLPYTLFTTICTLPVTVVCSLLEKKFKDRAFHNSVRFVIRLLLWPLLFIIYTTIAFLCLPQMWALTIIAALLPAIAVTQDTHRAVRMAVSDFKLFCNRRLRAKYDEIRKFF
ncbi:MAG: 1-acyl-sn-glycerol-3-phosphate acyltransferase [Bacteroidaceae bacterium]|nr:1-acyl-sn-glycerol-3-phosphate acyltransferase [Bacteroidaceae bacterium]